MSPHGKEATLPSEGYIIRTGRIMPSLASHKSFVRCVREDGDDVGTLRG
jgi:hypothetical protein